MEIGGTTISSQPLSSAKGKYAKRLLMERVHKICYNQDDGAPGPQSRAKEGTIQLAWVDLDWFIVRDKC